MCVGVCFHGKEMIQGYHTHKQIHTHMSFDYDSIVVVDHFL
jgi:hypothetical protein